MFDTRAAERFRDDNYLCFNTLTKSTVLEYFYMSPFYELTGDCINQKRRRGMQVPDDADGVEYTTLATCDAADNSLRAAIGAVWNHPNQFGTFVIQKINRVGGRETPLAVYYCLGGTIYSAVSIASLVRRRVQAAAIKMSSLLEQMESMTTWSTLTGHGWSQPQVPRDCVLTGATIDPQTEATIRTLDAFSLRPLAKVDEVLEIQWQDMVSDVNGFIESSASDRLKAAEVCLATAIRPDMLNMLRKRLKLEAGLSPDETVEGDVADSLPEAAESMTLLESVLVPLELGNHLEERLQQTAWAWGEFLLEVEAAGLNTEALTDLDYTNVDFLDVWQISDWYLFPGDVHLEVTDAVELYCCQGPRVFRDALIERRGVSTDVKCADVTDCFQSALDLVNSYDLPVVGSINERPAGLWRVLQADLDLMEPDLALDWNDLSVGVFAWLAKLVDVMQEIYLPQKRTPPATVILETDVTEEPLSPVSQAKKELEAALGKTSRCQSLAVLVDRLEDLETKLLLSTEHFENCRDEQQDSVGRLRLQLEDAHKEVEDLQSVLANKNSELSALKQMLERNSRLEADNEVTALLETERMRMAACEHENQGLMENLQSQVEQLTSNLNEARSQISSVTECNATLEAQLAQKRLREQDSSTEVPSSRSKAGVDKAACCVTASTHTGTQTELIVGSDAVLEAKSLLKNASKVSAQSAMEFLRRGSSLERTPREVSQEVSRQASVTAQAQFISPTQLNRRRMRPVRRRPLS